MKKTYKNILLLFIVVILIAVPILVIKDSEFAGSDSLAEEAIPKSYTPWFNPLWEPPGGETETLIFTLQGAIGTGIIAYFLGYMKGKTKNANN
ncbi:energy-coupling factor ABC transporter substrate-binding protein [Senegalia massiliensis]|uniref:energy-coupling factor ABC transporter substrate-binding protein n=1 Tax=Senegalia massiliensis TaxID=1720316 RepID=UPI0010319296|nr:energy-coupling factor ABC transporter substrate-binding protein [Senegalia massiliensis]